MHNALAAFQIDPGMPLIASWGGLLSLILSVISLAAVLVGYGRWLEKLNGMGKRVKDLETESATAKAEREGFRNTLERINGTLDHLNQDIGEHKRDTTACREDTEKLGIDLGAKIYEQTQAVHRMENTLSNRLTAVETVLKERNIK